MKDRSDAYWSKLTSALARQAGTLHLDSVHTKLGELSLRVRERHPLVDRIAFAIYDPQDGTLKGILDRNGRKPGTARPYTCSLAAAPTLAELERTREPRVLNDMLTEIGTHSEHSRWLIAEGYRSSLTVPVEQEGRFLGFLFFDSRTPWAFGEAVVTDLLLLAHLIGVVVKQELASVEMLIGSLRLTRQFADLRDVETGEHLDRMSRYSQVIAREIAAGEALGQDFIDLLELFAPLHDIGKVGVPDSVLHKPGPLDAGERRVMDSHVPLGLTMADSLLRDFGLQALDSVRMLRNVIAHHHEALDGSGYPSGLRGEAIPLESRIVATADVLDALTCKRSYKPAWSIRDALAEVRKLGGVKLDERCVDALHDCRDEVEAIHQAFHEAA